MSSCQTKEYLEIMFRALHQQKKKDEEDIRYRETEEAREFSKMRMFGRPGHGAPTVDNRKKRFTEHQFDKLRHGGQDGPGAAGVNYQPEEYRPPPPPSRRFQEDVLDNVSLLLTDRLSNRDLISGCSGLRSSWLRSAAENQVWEDQDGHLR